MFGPNLDPVVERAPCEISLVTLHDGTTGDGTDPLDCGEAVADAADCAGFAPNEYDTEVVADGDVEGAILDAVNRYDTVCVGLSERSDASRTTFGTIAERISREATGNVDIVRGAYEPPPTEAAPSIPLGRSDRRPAGPADTGTPVHDHRGPSPIRFPSPPAWVKRRTA